MAEQHNVSCVKSDFGDDPRWRKYIVEDLLEPGDCKKKTWKPIRESIEDSKFAEALQRGVDIDGIPLENFHIYNVVKTPQGYFLQSDWI